MRQMQVCALGHRWDPIRDHRPSEYARWNVCPVCGGSVEMFSMRDTNDGSNSTPSADAPAEAPPATPTDPGLPGYEILSTIGYGGMGVVYRARQLEPRRIVAVKMLSAGIRARPNDLARFHREIEAASKLNHPHIVQVLEVGEHGGVPYVTMEYMDRGSLQDAIAGNPIPPRRAAGLVELVARAVQFAHDNGIIHRDLKPGNVLLTVPPETMDRSTPGYSTMMLLGMPKVADFGLAKRVDDEGAQTRTGAIMGTPCYMAPEQAMGKTRTVDARADVYALGAILYECLTGQPPFQATTPLEVLDLVRSQDPDRPSNIQPGIPKNLEIICLKCLEKQPENRYASAQELADDLRRFLNDESIIARPSPRWKRSVRWLRKHAMLAVVTLLAMTTLGLAASLMSLWYKKPPSETVEYYTNIVKVHGVPRGVGRLTVDQVKQRSLAFRLYSVDGQVTKVEAVDRHGRLSPRHGIVTHLSPFESGLFAINSFLNVVETPLRSRSPGSIPFDGPGRTAVWWEYQRDDRGNLTKEIAHDVMGRVVWTFQLTSNDSWHYTDERGMILTRAGSGASYVKLFYTDEGWEKEVRFLGRTGNPRPDFTGIFGRRYEHDANGLVTKVLFLGPRGQLVPHPLGYAQIARTWDASGLLLEEKYLDLRGKPARGFFGRGTLIRWTYDEHGRPTSQVSYDLNGNPMSGSMRFTYDSAGRLIVREMTHPAPTPAGERPRAVRTIFDYADDNCFRISYFDAEGKPAPGSYGAVRLGLHWDEQRRITGIVFLNENDQPTPPRANGSETSIAFEYNAAGQIISEAFFAADGKPTVDRFGVARYTYRYDERGQILELMRSDVQGRLVQVGSPPFARRTWKYDEQGQLEETATYDAAGRIVVFDDTMTARSRNWETLTSLFVDPRRYAATMEFAAGRLLVAFDDRGNLVQARLFGPDGEPMADRQGIALVQARYDELGNLAELTTYDELGKLKANPSGIARTIWAYDALGNMTEIATYGPRGELLAGEFGVARQTRKFDARYNLIEEAFYGADGELTNGVVGYARVQFQYNAEDHLVRSTYYDDKDNPVKTRVVWLYGSNRLGATLGMEPAAKQLEAGDVILSYNGVELHCARLFDQLKREEGQEGSPKEVKILRKGEPLTLSIPAGALRGDDFFSRERGGGPRSRFGRLFIPGAPEPGAFIQTRSEAVIDDDEA